MFSINTRDMKTLHSYEACATFFKNAKPWRDYDANKRPLTDRRAKHKAIVYDAKEDAYRLELYDTALVIYYADGRIGVQGHRSKSSAAFAHHFLPYGMYPYFSQAGGPYVSYSNPEGTCVVQRIGTGAVSHFTPKNNGWELTLAPGVTPFVIWALDKEKGRKALKETGYNDFRDWLRAYKALNPNDNGWGRTVDPLTNQVPTLQLLIDRNFVALKDRYGHVHALDSVRNQVYKHMHCIVKTYEQEGVLESSFHNLLTQNRRWEHM